MSNYRVVATPATIGTMVSMVLIGAAYAGLHEMEDSMDRTRPVSSGLSNVARYVEGSDSPTTGICYGFSVVNTDEMLAKASAGFAAQMIGGAEALGFEYLEVIEDNFWDLVLR